MVWPDDDRSWQGRVVVLHRGRGAGGGVAGIETMMVTDLDIYRSAKLLVDEHGDTAAIEAAQQADALLDAGDLDGAAVWRRIVRAVRGLLRRVPVGAVVSFRGRSRTAWRRRGHGRFFGAGASGRSALQPPLLLGPAGIMDHIANCLELGVDPKQEPRDRAEGGNRQEK